MVAQGAPCSRLTPCLVGHLARVFPHSATLQGPQHGAQGAAPGADFCPGLLPRRFLIWTEKRAWATVPQHRRISGLPAPTRIRQRGHENHHEKGSQDSTKGIKQPTEGGTRNLLPDRLLISLRCATNYP